MAEDTKYYPDDEPDESSPGEDDGGSGMEEGGVQTALIPKSLLMGKEFNPGDEVVLEIVHLYEDEVEVKYAPEKKDKKEEKEGMDDMHPEDQLDSMAREPEMASMGGGGY